MPWLSASSGSILNWKFATQVHFESLHPGRVAFNHSPGQEAEAEYDRLRDQARAEARERNDCFDRVSSGTDYPSTLPTTYGFGLYPVPSSPASHRTLLRFVSSHLARNVSRV